MLQKHLLLTVIFFLFTNISTMCAEKYQYILNDPSILKIHLEASETINHPEIFIIKDAIGIIIRFKIDNPIEELCWLSRKTINSLKEIEKFLAKIKKPAIIEVHTEKFVFDNRREIKNWEVSTIIANNIETFFIQNSNTISKEDIKSIGYGEFMPAKNTPNNGGKYSNRIDIIIPCSISGE